MRAKRSRRPSLTERDVSQTKSNEQAQEYRTDEPLDYATGLPLSELPPSPWKRHPSALITFFFCSFYFLLSGWFSSAIAHLLLTITTFGIGHYYVTFNVTTFVNRIEDGDETYTRRVVAVIAICGIGLIASLWYRTAHSG